YSIGCGLSDNGRWLVIEVFEGVPPKHSEIYFQDILTPGAPLRTLLKEDAEVSASPAADWLFLLTNAKTPNRKVMRVDLKDPAPEHWKPVIPESSLAIQQISTAGKRLFVTYLENASTRMSQFDADGKPLGDLKLPGIVSAHGPYGRWEDDEAFL